MTLDMPTLAALRARTDDLDAFRVLADRLQAEGDPRGELISLQLLGQPRLVERHLAMHARALLGRLFTHQSSLALGWEAGFIRHATVSSQEGFVQRRWDGRLVAEHRTRRPFAWLTAELLQLESAVLLETLSLSLVRSSRTKELFAAALEAVARFAPPTVTRLTVHCTPEPYDRYAWERGDDPDEVMPWSAIERQVAFHGRHLTLVADEVSLLDHAHAVLRDGG
ncbi:MAG: hypothetical protein QM723_26445 [Myxococcaceae bacterium]